MTPISKGHVAATVRTYSINNGGDMYGLETIKAMNEEAGERARLNGAEPYHLQNLRDLNNMPPFPFPNIGDMEVEVDKLHERVDTIFCDSSGFGRDDEPALTVGQLMVRLRELYQENRETGIRLAIVSEGQFQLYIGVWR